MRWVLREAHQREISGLGPVPVCVEFVVGSALLVSSREALLNIILQIQCKLQPSVCRWPLSL